MRGCCLPLCLPLSVPLLGGALRARGVFLRALVLSPSQASPWGLRVAACGHCLLECGHESWQPGGGGLGQLSPRPLGEFGPPFLASTYRKVCARLLDLRDRVDLVDAKNTHHLCLCCFTALGGKNEPGHKQASPGNFSWSRASTLVFVLLWTKCLFLLQW